MGAVKGTNPMRKLEIQMNRAISNRSDWKLANTRVEYEEGNCISRVYLHGNKIAEIGETFITLYDGGWQSVTTKSRLNAILREHGGGSIYQKNFEWFVYDPTTQKSEEFASGMTLY
jgi:hypothetical protein